MSLVAKNQVIGAGLVAILAATLGACMQGPGLFKQREGLLEHSTTTVIQSNGQEKSEAPKVVVETRQEEGKAIGLITPRSDVQQVIPAASNSEIAGSTVTFPPGSVALDTEITLAPAENIATVAAVQQLQIGEDGVASAAPAVVVSSSVPMDTAVPFTVAIPIPDAGSSLRLEEIYSRLVVIYRVTKVAQNAEVSGVMTRESLALEGGYVKFLTNHFGTFQAIITKNLVVAKTEVPTEQIVAAEEVQPEPEPEPEPEEKPDMQPRLYWVKGAVGTRFPDGGQSADGFQGWLHVFRPARVGHERTLTTGYIETAAAP